MISSRADPSILSAAKRNTVINLNGKIIPLEAANVSVFDRSFLYGDSVYEVVRTYQGKPFRLKEHLQRMKRSAALCQMEFSQSLEEYEREILKSIAAFRASPSHQKSDVYVRMIVSRGAGKIGFGLGNLETPTLYVILVEPISLFPNAPLEKGVKLEISKRMRNHPKALDPAMKSGNYLNSLLAYLTAAEKGFDDSLMLDYQDFMTEGTTYNIFYVNRGIVATAPLDVGILDGVTRRAIINLCVEHSIPCREVRFPKEYLYGADEVFVSSSLKEIMPVLQLDDRRLKGPGKITLQLREALQNLIQTELQLLSPE